MADEESSKANLPLPPPVIPSLSLSLSFFIFFWKNVKFSVRAPAFFCYLFICFDHIWVHFVQMNIQPQANNNPMYIH